MFIPFEILAVVKGYRGMAKLQFLGAAETVTGSKYLLKTFNRKILIDCGLFQGEKDLREQNWAPFPADVTTLDAVVLTHAHIDHSGYIPRLVAQGFRGPIYATRATVDLAEILLKDSGRLQEEDANLANMYDFSKHKPALPLYTEKDAMQALTQFKTIDYGTQYQLGEELSFHASRAGHILGSAIITFNVDSEVVVFSGDLGRPEDLIMKKPAEIQVADVLVLESTYGNKKHTKEDPIQKLGAIIRKTAKQGGTVLIPSFAVGRTQTILYILYLLRKEDAIPDIPIYLDSPMAQDATDILLKHLSEHKLSRETAAEVCKIAEYVQTSDRSKQLNFNTKPKIIISASGMAEGGRVLHHIKYHGPKPENTIVFVGFQAPMTRGEKILDGAKEVKIHGEMIPIRARVEYVDSLSSHADYEEILGWLKKFVKAPKLVFLTHGDIESALALKARIEDAFGWNVIIPKHLQEFTI